MIEITGPEKIVPKGWGEEIVIDNNDEYCGKILKFRKGEKFSNHFHISKRETFFVLAGKFMVKSANLSNGDWFEHTVGEGAVVKIPRFEPHQLTALEDGTIIEFSTHHEDSDSYRIEKGASQVPRTS